MAERENKVFDIEGLGRYLRVPTSTLYKLAQSGKVPGQKVGRRWRFLKSAIDRWLESFPAKPQRHGRQG